MERKYWDSQVQIIDIFKKHCGGIVSLKIDDESMVIVTNFVDMDIVPCVEKICKEGGLCYLFKPYTIERMLSKKGSNKKTKSKPGVLWKIMLPTTP